jgi:two-component system, OmpR family, phosphate regulon sensor histidine kinase PhoR
MSGKNQPFNQAQLYLDIAGVIMMALNRMGEITLINKKGCEVLEYTEEELIGKNWFLTCLPNDIKNDVYEVFKRLISGEIEKAEFYENPVLTKSGKLKTIAWHNAYLLDNDGNIIATLSSGEDITERKRIEEEKNILEKLKEDFLARVSHELKTPLISIVGYTDLFLIKYGSILDEEAKRYLNSIRKATERLNDLAERLLTVQELEVEKLKLQKSRGNIGKVIEESIYSLNAYAKTRDISIYLDLQEDLIFNFDIEKIQDLINNLILNALKYSPPKGSIKVHSKLQNDHVIISIEDDGIGFTKEEQQVIFQKFGKIEHFGENLDVDIGGVGMGLYIAKRITELHDGEIWVSSPGRNKGSTFYVSLPIR